MTSKMPMPDSTGIQKNRGVLLESTCGAFVLREVRLRIELSQLNA